MVLFLLLHQLISAYHSSSVSFSYPSLTTPTPPPSSQVLGTSITAPTPINVGGEGKIIKIAVLGDSMIDTLEPNIPQLESALKQFYPYYKFNIINHGAGGSNIENGLFRLLNDYEYLGTKRSSIISQKPDIIVVESFAYNNFGNSQSGIDRQWLALGAITTNIRQLLPNTKIFLAATIAPNSIIFGNSIPGTQFTSLDKIEKSTNIKLYLENLINFATSQHFPLADAYHPSLVNGEGNKNLISSRDHLHPSGYGGQLFCNTVAKTIFDNQLIE
jgi:hypothetical protein